jgi:hypothetical protein
MKSRYDDALLENQRLQDRVDSMEFVRRNYNSSTRPLYNSSISGGGGGGNSYLPPTSSSRSGRTPSVSRFTSVEREMDPSIPPPYRSRDPSVSRRNSRDYSNDRWSSTSRRDSSTAGSYGENDLKTSNKRRSDRWSAVNSPNMSSSNYNFSSLPGRIYLHVNGSHEDFTAFAWFFFVCGLNDSGMNVCYFLIGWNFRKSIIGKLLR